jgi:hypothetical protein
MAALSNLYELSCHQRDKKQALCNFARARAQRENAASVPESRWASAFLVQLRRLERKRWPPTPNQTQPKPRSRVFDGLHARHPQALGAGPARRATAPAAARVAPPSRSRFASVRVSIGAEVTVGADALFVDYKPTTAFFFPGQVQRGRASSSSTFCVVCTRL